MKPKPRKVDPETTPQQEAALNLLQGGTVEDFCRSIDNAAKAQALVEYLREHPDQVKRGRTK